MVSLSVFGFVEWFVCESQSLSFTHSVHTCNFPFCLYSVYSQRCFLAKGLSESHVHTYSLTLSHSVCVCACACVCVCFHKYLRVFAELLTCHLLLSNHLTQELSCPNLPNRSISCRHQIQRTDTTGFFHWCQHT